ncbi:hypothetical protein K437DRAFT_262190 [Tilletiaria anomala UBC 951]|uniref:Carbohydrate esterase family 16 protein n=1 Tax=Tilletiaria anomala (strain ATCC 24038 / CBS 436.72 / UBC 951) TaxID=1037660 RepID=A0A066W443_TILAU|nr:uncharacterized protein K437DRAFT_262190 [Tilletiaria anomala UBC 951]KDN48496.1 hypothetical protein K437DRAFT_262190 [Tilletiaria anomala UBC 951]
MRFSAVFGLPKVNRKTTSTDVTNLVAFSAATCGNALWSGASVNDIKQQIQLARFSTPTPRSNCAALYGPAMLMAAIYIDTNDISYFLADLAEAVPHSLSLGLRGFVLLENIPLQKYKATVLVGKWNDSSFIDVFPTYDSFEFIFAHPAEYDFNKASTYDVKHGYFENSLHPSGRANQILASKMQRFLLGGASLISGNGQSACWGEQAQPAARSAWAWAWVWDAPSGRQPIKRSGGVGGTDGFNSRGVGVAMACQGVIMSFISDAESVLPRAVLQALAALSPSSSGHGHKDGRLKKLADRAVTNFLAFGVATRTIAIPVA